jgi:hypothetical protein
MIAMAPDKKWASLTARERTPFVLRGPSRSRCSRRRLRTPTAVRSRRSAAGSGCEAWWPGELYGHRSYRLFRLRPESRLMGLELERKER